MCQNDYFSREMLSVKPCSSTYLCSGICLSTDTAMTTAAAADIAAAVQWL